MSDNQLNPVIGIDLGTTFSCVAYWNDDRPEVYRLSDGSQTLPSIVYIQDGGKPLVGKFARQRLIIDPLNAVEKAKRFMGEEKQYSLRGEDYSPVDISRLILERLRDDIQSKFPSNSGFDLAGAVVTHPHYFKFPQIARTQEAAEAAGLPVIRLLSEPVAAALDYGFTMYRNLEDEKSERLLIFDLGGGTFDVTVLQVTNSLNELKFQVLSVGGDDMLGGTNFDEDFMAWVLKDQNIDLEEIDNHESKLRSIAKIAEAVIEAKIQLSSLEETYVSVPNVLPGKHLDGEVSREQFETIIEPHCERIRAIVTSTIAGAGLRAGEIDKSIMIGGSSYIPIMRRIVEEETGAEPWANADPNLAVCRGAAFLAAMEDGRVDTKKEIIIEEVTSHALGLRAAGNKFAQLIPGNRRAPVQATKIFTTESANFEVIPYQGPSKRNAVIDDKYIKLKPIDISGVELSSDGSADVKVTFSINEQQMLFVKVEAPGVFEERQMEY